MKRESPDWSCKNFNALLKIGIFMLLTVFLLSPTSSLAENEKGVGQIPAPADYKKLVGTWVRPDGGYVLVIKNVRDDGNIDAAYFNPGTIRVSEARVSTKADRLNIYVELRDTGYPGSNYTLTYEPDTDRLVGVYHHMVLKKKFDIFFVRE